MHKIKGFTLIEILIAIFIFAIISVIASTVLASVFNAREHTAARMQQLNQIQLTTLLLQRDLKQLVNRPVRAANSNVIPALLVNSNSVEFTRMGNANPFGALQQSNLQRVAYEIKNGALLRITWPRLDRVSSTLPETRILLTGILSGNFTFLGQGTTFYNNWPPGNLINNTQTGEPIPRAIAINLQLKNWGHYYLLIAIPSSQL